MRLEALAPVEVDADVPVPVLEEDPEPDREERCCADRRSRPSARESMERERNEQRGPDDGREDVPLDVRARRDLRDDHADEREEQEADRCRDLELRTTRRAQEHDECSAEDEGGEPDPQPVGIREAENTSARRRNTKNSGAEPRSNSVQNAPA